MEITVCTFFRGDLKIGKKKVNDPLNERMYCCTVHHVAQVKGLHEVFCWIFVVFAFFVPGLSENSE